jgi:FixJ family two-component response regulator
MPGFSGLEMQRMLAERGDRRPIIFLTGHGDIAMTVRAMKAGAAEFLPKPFRAAALLEAVEQALLRDGEEQVERGERVEIRRRSATLSPREHQVMLLTVSGLLNKQVAARLSITEATVKVHRARVMEKMAAGSLPDSCGWSTSSPRTPFRRQALRPLPPAGSPRGKRGRRTERRDRLPAAGRDGRRGLKR